MLNQRFEVIPSIICCDTRTPNKNIKAERRARQFGHKHDMFRNNRNMNELVDIHLVLRNARPHMNHSQSRPQRLHPRCWRPGVQEQLDFPGNVVGVVQSPAIDLDISKFIKAEILIQNYRHGFGCSRRHIFESGQAFSSSLGLKSPQNCAGTCESNTPVYKQNNPQNTRKSSTH